MNLVDVVLDHVLLQGQVQVGQADDLAEEVLEHGQQKVAEILELLRVLVPKHVAVLPHVIAVPAVDADVTDECQSDLATVIV